MEQQTKRREGIRGVGAGDEDDAYEIVVSWGEETFSPVQYNSFRAGGVSLRTQVRPAESPEEAHERCMRHLRAMTERQFEEQLRTFLDRLRIAGSQARGTR